MSLNFLIVFVLKINLNDKKHFKLIKFLKSKIAILRLDKKKENINTAPK